MIKKVFTVYDAKVEVYLDPIMVRGKGEAVRIMINTMKQPGNVFADHPADFTLFEIGEWDDHSGRYTEHEAHVPVNSLLEIKAMLENSQYKE